MTPANLIAAIPDAKTLIGHFEGDELTSYVLHGETWATIGRGHAIPLSQHPKTITQAVSDMLFDADVQHMVDEIIRVVRPDMLAKMNYGLLVATISFRFNSIPNQFNGSTFLKDLNAGRFTAAASELSRWIHGGVNGKEILPGLIRRRKCEQFLATGGTIQQLQAKNYFAS